MHGGPSGQAKLTGIGRCTDEDDRCQCGLADTLAGVDTVEWGRIRVDQDQVRPQLFGEVERLPSVLSLSDSGVAEALQLGSEAGASRYITAYDQHSQWDCRAHAYPPFIGRGRPSVCLQKTEKGVT